MFRSFILIYDFDLEELVENYGLNPFVQVFYSNFQNLIEKSISEKKTVLIPLFRSFILIPKFMELNIVMLKVVLIPLFRSFILITKEM